MQQEVLELGDGAKSLGGRGWANGEGGTGRCWCRSFEKLRLVHTMKVHPLAQACR